MKIPLILSAKEIDVQEYRIPTYRLRTLAFFRKAPLDKESFTSSFEGIVDTGAMVSVIPSWIWKTIAHKKLCETWFAGVSEKKDCRIPCYLGIIHMALGGPSGNKSSGFTSIAFLSHQDNIPLILGFTRCLEYFQLEFNIPKQEASLQWEGISGK